MNRIILHSDCNNFYASVECHLNPEIKDKAVIICGNPQERTGIVLAKNELAKKYGISTGDTIWQAQRKCPNILKIRPTFRHYVDYSNRVKEIYCQYTNLVEPFGIDEAWLDITAIPTKLKPVEIAKEIKERIKKEIGITVSIGVSFNKTFAKIGSDYKKPDAITVISPQNYKRIVWALDCSDLLYVGKATKKKLNNLGIHTIGDLAKTDKEIIVKNFGKVGISLHEHANGIDYDAVLPFDYNALPKSIGNSTTTYKDLKSIEEVKLVLNMLCQKICTRMRKESLYCKNISIQVKNSMLVTTNKQKNIKEFTNVTREIYKNALLLFIENFTVSNNNPIRSIGVSISDFTQNKPQTQLSLFANDNEDSFKREKLSKLDYVCDDIKSKYGKNSVVNASLLRDIRLSKVK